eukprot:TRINITY_DN514_c0_g1_i1.p1 TRINITY_DN514_c0_g1~~TRINITY_DN514_c0_g1_i1.p1  ORF type:complete len:970 (-),score=299.34 TRINITY_DN514_c0_g1_i1:41-2950(-)
MTTQANPFETLSGVPEHKDSENNSLGDNTNAPSTYSLAKDSIPTDFIGRDGNYSKEEMLALFKPDYSLPEEFVFHPMVMTKEAMQPVAFTPDEGRFAGKQSSAFQRGGRGSRGFSTRGGRGGPPRGRGGRGGKIEGESKFSAFGREGEAGSWRDKRRERGEDDHEGEDEEYDYHEDGGLDRSTDLSESKDDDWDEVKKKKKKKKELDSSMDMKLRHSQEATKKEEVKKEVAADIDNKAAVPLEKPKPTIPSQPMQPQPVVEKPATAPVSKPAETPSQGTPQLTLSAVQDALKQQLEGTTWVYKDSQGIDHGPYPSSKMNEWIVHNYLQADLILRKVTDNKWVYLGELILMEQRNPFTGQPLAEWVQSGTIPVLLHYQLLQLHQVLVQQQQQQQLPVNMQHASPLPFHYPGTQHVNSSLDQSQSQPTASALLHQLQHLAQQTSPAQQAGWPNQGGWGSPSPQRAPQPVYPASPQPPQQVHGESGLTRKQGVFKIEDLEGKSSAPKQQKREESPFSDLWGMNFGSLEKSNADKSQQSAVDDSNWETNKPKSKKSQPAQAQQPTPPHTKKQAQAPQPQQVQPQSPPQQPIVSAVPAPWANAAHNKGTSIKSIQEEDYKDYVTRQQREQQEFEERFKQQQALQQRLATPWGSGGSASSSSGSFNKIQEEEMRRKQEEMRRKEQERAGIVEPEQKVNWAGKQQKPATKGKPNMREILEEEARERERQKREGYSQPQQPQPKLGAWASPEKTNMSVREILEEEERMAQLESQKKAQAAPQPQQQAANWANKDSKKQSNFSAKANDVPLREVQQQEFKHQQKQSTPQPQQQKGGNKKTVSLSSIQQEQQKQRQIQSRNAPVQTNTVWKANNAQAVSMRDILRQEEAVKGVRSNTNNQAAANDDDENFWDYNPNQEAANNNAPVVSADEFPALMSTVKKEDKIKQALGGKQQAKGKKKGRSVDPNLLGFAAPAHEEQ